MEHTAIIIGLLVLNLIVTTWIFINQVIIQGKVNIKIMTRKEKYDREEALSKQCELLTVENVALKKLIEKKTQPVV